MSQSLFTTIYNLLNRPMNSLPINASDPNVLVSSNTEKSLHVIGGLPSTVLNIIAPQLSLTQADEFAEAISHFMTIYNITSTELPMFLTQSLYESMYFTRLEENLYYTKPEFVVNAWPSRFNMATAMGYLRNPAKLGNYVYANRFGNGDVASGDGYLYRGRSLFMYTFKANYLELAKHWGMNLAQCLEHIITPSGAVSSAMHFWQLHNMNRFTTLEDVPAATEIIQGGKGGLQAREDLFTKVDNVV